MAETTTPKKADTENLGEAKAQLKASMDRRLIQFGDKDAVYLRKKREYDALAARSSGESSTNTTSN